MDDERIHDIIEQLEEVAPRDDACAEIRQVGARDRLWVIANREGYLRMAALMLHGAIDPLEEKSGDRPKEKRSRFDGIKFPDGKWEEYTEYLAPRLQRTFALAPGFRVEGHPGPGETMLPKRESRSFADLVGLFGCGLAVCGLIVVCVLAVIGFRQVFLGL